MKRRTHEFPRNGRWISMITPLLGVALNAYIVCRPKSLETTLTTINLFGRIDLLNETSLVFVLVDGDAIKITSSNIYPMAYIGVQFASDTTLEVGGICA